ncbi:hypothetical protein QN277_000968 [Acacia crassicarpa]|uniref:Uncharacterized protein n=1 Tax=Acacia crassicarpa TaxID=499986 RepID=A0AAE1N7M4_9FABA|nr:hypothetical protein QN277_000968 [Acacia crassicarpa]
MATITSISLFLSFPKPSPQFPSSSSSLKTFLLHRPKLFRSFTVQANESEPSPSDSSEQAKSESESDSSTPASDDDFDTRMNEFRLRYRSGTGKKAEMRKVKKSRKGTASSGSGSGVYLPPVALKEPVSGGLKVDVGFSPYSERLNGRIAILGLAALLLVELATGKGVINFHTPAVVLIQIYFVAAVSALYVKYEKEKISVWPQSSRDE